MTSINFVFRPSSRVGNYQGSLCMRLIHCRKVKVLTLPGCNLFPKEWDKKRQQIVYPSGNPVRSKELKVLTNKLKEEQLIIHSYITILHQQGKYTVEDIARLYNKKRSEGKLSSYTEFLAQELEQRGQERTARAYRTVSRGLVHFNQDIDIKLCNITPRLIHDFERNLREKGKLPNTISYYMRNLRAIYNKAVRSQLIVPSSHEHPFSGVYTGITKTMKRALSLEELRKLHALDFNTPTNRKESQQERLQRKKLSQSWRYFFFCFHARGMSFVDMAYLKKENIRDGVIRYCRKKTGVQIEIRMTAILRSLIASFSEETQNSPYLFPIICNDSKRTRLWYENALRTQNHHLKILAGRAGIRKGLSTHVARHSWATIGKQKNVPLRILSDCLGHTSEHTTLIYLDTLENSELDQANKLVSSTLLKASSGTYSFNQI